MGSHGAAAAAANNTNNDNPSADYSLSRQGSLYSLTLDEFQTQLGNKPLSTMNLDELLRTVWIAESNCENNGSSAATVQPNHNIRLMPSSGSPPPSLHAQSSNLSLFPHDLCTKTVDQVWREISKKGNKTSNGTPGCGAGERSYEDCQQPTLGEMTLEDFLAQAGVIGEVGGSGSNASAHCGGSGLMGIVVEPIAAQQHCQWIQYQAQQFMPSGGHQSGGGGQEVAATKTNLMMDSANLSDAPLSPPSFILETLSDTQAPVPLRKRVASKEVMVERTVERRQKRMIKNRESAARSRARKQAYTNELENKVSRLEEENKRLRRMKEAEKVLPSLPPPEPKCHQLRRTNSGPL